MKANAPEKVYIHKSQHWGLMANERKITKDAVEYTRTDAFIEKAADYIKKDMLDNLAFQGRLNRIEIIDGIIEKFIKAMKGITKEEALFNQEYAYIYSSFAS